MRREEALLQAHDSDCCKCAADIYNMKAMAARPAAPKPAALAASPLKVATGVAGLVVLAAGAGAGAQVLQVCWAGAAELAAAQVSQVVTAAGLEELHWPHSAELVAFAVLVTLAELVVQLPHTVELVSLTGVELLEVQADQEEVLVTLTGVEEVLVEVQLSHSALELATAAAEAAPAKITAPKAFILIDWFLVDLFGWNERLWVGSYS